MKEDSSLCKLLPSMISTQFFSYYVFCVVDITEDIKDTATNAPGNVLQSNVQGFVKKCFLLGGGGGGFLLLVVHDMML